MDDGTLQPGTVVSGYRIERWIARGGMGEVYEATQLSLDRRVAFKLISRALGADQGFRDRFRREAVTAASLDHSSILPVHEAGEIEDGRLFLAMRFVEGQDLESYLETNGPMDPRSLIAVLGQIGEALDVAHESGLIHRDVKPANVMLENRRDGVRAYLTDFGLAKQTDVSRGLTETGAVLGTVDYMAPEQVNGLPADGRADVYAFGCMVYRCITGEVPYPRPSVPAVMYAHAHEPVPVPSQRDPRVPKALDMVVMWAMEKDRDRRAQSAGALMQWAAPQLGGRAPGETAHAGSLIAAPESAPAVPPTVAARPSHRFRLRTRVGVHLVLYAPLWAGAYLLGRSL
jgi:serine/threonine protein kinase